MKTFCGILLCCLDASAIIKRNSIEFHDYSLIVKYAHFSILLLLLLAQVTYNQVQPSYHLAKQALQASSQYMVIYVAISQYSNLDFIISQATVRSIILWSALPGWQNSLNAIYTQDLACLNECSGLPCDTHTISVPL